MGVSAEPHYTVRQLARIAGVSARTLHYYDEIGLLRPERNPYNQYRLYGRKAVLRLQQILFLRELGLALEEIHAVIDRPEFDLLQALEQHHKALVARQQRLGHLLETVERTILYLKGMQPMNDHELFAAFSEEQQQEYAEEAVRRWGETARQSQRLWASYSSEKKRQVMDEGSQIYRELIAAIPAGPASPQAQALVARWHQHLRYFYEPTPEILLGLADAYNDDEAFNATFRKMHPELAPFMRAAVRQYLKK